MSISGKFAPIISVAAPSRVRRLRPVWARAAPTSVWQMLSNFSALFRQKSFRKLRDHGVRGVDDVGNGALTHLADKRVRIPFAEPVLLDHPLDELDMRQTKRIDERPR